MHDLALALFFCLPWVGFWWCCCSGCTGSYCDANSWNGTLATAMVSGGACRGPRPTTATITISGLTNKVCDQCALVSGTYVATLGIWTNCRWLTQPPDQTLYNANPTLCSEFYFDVSIRCSDKGKVRVIVAINFDGASGTQLHFQNIQNDAPAHCSSMGVLTMTPYSDTNVRCGYDGGTTMTVELT